MLVVLSIIVKNKNIGLLNLMKIAAPRYVRGLKNDAIYQRTPLNESNDLKPLEIFTH